MTRVGTGEARFPAHRVVLSAAIYVLEFAIIVASYFGLADPRCCCRRSIRPQHRCGRRPGWRSLLSCSAAIAFGRRYCWELFPLMPFRFSDAVTARSLLQSASIAIGITLAALAGAWLINRWSYG